MEYARDADDRLFGQFASYCDSLLDQLTRIAKDPKSLDAIKLEDRANLAQQQAHASEIEQL